jgi:hypothetical protein
MYVRSAPKSGLKLTLRFFKPWQQVEFLNGFAAEYLIIFVFVRNRGYSVTRGEMNGNNCGAESCSAFVADAIRLPVVKCQIRKEYGLGAI